MKELGRGANLVYGGAVGAKPVQHGLSDPTKAGSSIGAADDDAAAATIRNARRAEIPNAYESLGSANSAAERAKMLSDFLAAVKEKIAVMEELFERSADAESGTRSWATVGERALRALRCQEDLDPERVLSLLRDELTEAGAAPQ